MAEVLLCDHCEKVIGDQFYKVERDSRLGGAISRLSEPNEWHLHFECMPDWGGSEYERKQSHDYKRSGTVRGKQPGS